jgi:transposase
MRTRSDRLAHVHNPNAPYTWPAIGKQIAYKAHREGVAERLHAPAVHKPSEVDLALITSDDALRRAVELALLNTATQHDAQTLSWLQTVPGMGTILSLVLRYESHDIGRLPRGQDLAASARLVTCSKASAGKRLGTSGKPRGHAPRQGAFSEAATLFRRNNPNGQKLLPRLEKTQGKGHALTIRAHQLARAVYAMRKRKTACDLARFLRP